MNRHASVGPLDPGIRLIALFELVKGTAVLVLGLGLLAFVRRDLADTLTRWLSDLRVDPDNRYVHALIARASGLDARHLEAISAGSFLYAALRYVEGVGLLLRRRWGAWITLISTAAFVPVEIYEMLRRATPLRLGVFVINVAVLVYLIVRLRRERRLDRAGAPTAPGRLRPPRHA